MGKVEFPASPARSVLFFTSREHIIALEPRGKGLLGITLRYPYEVRKEDEYFEDIPDEKIPKDMLELASHIVETKSGHFEPMRCAEAWKRSAAGQRNDKPNPLRRAAVNPNVRKNHVS